MSQAIQSNRAVLRQHGRSFYWASFFLPAGASHRAADLYAFCRRIDDAVDEAPTAEVAQENIAVMENIFKASASFQGEYADLFAVLNECGLGIEPAKQLLYGVKSDFNEVLFEEEKQLLLYCYRVAGTVGLMMCPVLGVRDPKAWGYAIDLGIAMQLTNISRDVLEDARRKRIYLPQSWFGSPLGTEDIQKENGRAGEVSAAVLRALGLAEQHYQSAIRGLSYIPARARMAICIALILYREIGINIQEQWHGNSLNGRMYVGTFQKVKCVMKGVFLFAKTLFLRKPVLEGSVAKKHAVLHALPGV